MDISVCVLLLCLAPSEIKMESDPLELELQVAVSCHVGARF